MDDVEIALPTDIVTGIDALVGEHGRIEWQGRSVTTMPPIGGQASPLPDGSASSGSHPTTGPKPTLDGGMRTQHTMRKRSDDLTASVIIVEARRRVSLVVPS